MTKKPRPLKTSPEFFQRDAKAIAKLVEEIKRELGFYERNGPGDEMRFLFIDNTAFLLKRLAERAYRRYQAKVEKGKKP